MLCTTLIHVDRKLGPCGPSRTRGAGQPVPQITLTVNHFSVHLQRIVCGGCEIYGRVLNHDGKARKEKQTNTNGIKCRIIRTDGVAVAAVAAAGTILNRIEITQGLLIATSGTIISSIR